MSSMRDLMKKKKDNLPTTDKKVDRQPMDKGELLEALNKAPLDTTINIPVVLPSGEPPSPPEPKKKHKKAFDYLEHEQDMLDYIKTLKTDENTALTAVIRRVNQHKLPTFYIQSVKLFLKYLKERGLSL